jgi:uncharacterized membrane protein YphA (DoxX/SURF4 family)
MATTYSGNVSDIVPATENQVVLSTQTMLRFVYGLVPIVAGLDKFFNLLANWETYLNPLALRIVPVTDVMFMHIVGLIEIVAGVLTLARPRVGGFVVMAWLFAIALQLVLMGQFLDVAVRDCVMALGALTLARLSPFAMHREGSVRS